MKLIERMAVARSTSSADIWPQVFGAPNYAHTSDREEKARVKERAIVLTKIGLRPGNNNDILEMLGLIPAEVKS